MILHPLYIDPGTGSMIFSILFGISATLFFVLRAALIKIKVVLSGGRAAVSSGVSPYIIYNEGKQYWNVFKPVLDEFERRQTKILYLTSAEDDPVFESVYKYVRSDYIGEGNKAFARLNLLAADVVLMTTPSLDVYQLKRSKAVKHYAHILHAPSDATLYRLFGIDYFDSVLLTGDYQAKDIRTLETLRGLPRKQLVTVGCTYLDVAAEKIKNIEKEGTHPFTVLVSPSWGPQALLSRYGENLLTPLVETGWRIIVRPHPQSKKSEKDMLEKLTTRYGGNDNLEWDFERDNTSALSKSDIMISDFSGIIFDFSFLFDKPVIYVQQGFDLRPYDAGDLGENAEAPWQFRILRQIGVELKEEDFSSIKKVIREAHDSNELKTARRAAKETAWNFRGEAGKRVVDFMTATAGSSPAPVNFNSNL